MMDDDIAPPRRAGSRRQAVLHTLRRGVPAAILLAVLAAVFVYFQWEDHAPAPHAPQAPGDPVVVNVVAVEHEAVPLRPRFLGQTEASQTVEIRARVDGFLEQQAFEEGAVVEQGRLLYRIDPRSYRAELAVARSRLAAAEARLAQAQQDLEQIRQLRQQNAATQQELDDVLTAVRVAEAEVQLETARLAQAELDLGYTSIETPITGVIGESLKDVGAYVAPGAESLLAVVAQLDPIYIRFSVSEAEALRWEAGVAEGLIEMPDLAELDVTIELADGRTYAHAGHINYIDINVDPNTGTRVIRATVSNPNRLLTPGQSVHATLVGARRTGAILVPQQAVLQMPTGAMVYVVNDEGRVENRAITLGDWHEDRWIVESGLEPGDTVIIDRLMQLRPGTPVIPAPGRTEGRGRESEVGSQRSEVRGQESEGRGRRAARLPGGGGRDR